MHPKTLLLVLIVTVPFLVGASGLASFALLQMGYGFFTGAVVPFLGLLLLVAVLGVVLGRAAGRGGKGVSRKRPDDEPRPRNGV
ncbi:MAG: hypothetical protein M3157_01360 [Actinomycetota bacterium]|nr:hypothetical protein [Actinomycetota bacterium]